MLRRQMKNVSNYLIGSWSGKKRFMRGQIRSPAIIVFGTEKHTSVVLLVTVLVHSTIIDTFATT